MGAHRDARTRRPSTLSSAATSCRSRCLPRSRRASACGSSMRRGDPTQGYRVPADRTSSPPASPRCSRRSSRCSRLAGIFVLLAPMYRSSRNYRDALKVATFGAVPVLLAGATLLLPVMALVGVIAFVHSLFLFWLGAKQVLHVGREEQAEFVGIAMLLLSVAATIAGAAPAHWVSSDADWGKIFSSLFTVRSKEFPMALVSMRQLLDHAADNGYGLPAFNVNNLEQVQAIMAAAAETDSPVIMQASAGARKYAGEVFLRHLIQAAVESYPNIPVVMHQDHGQSPAVCQSAMKLGFSSRDDGRLAEGRRQDHRRLRVQRRRHAQGRRHGARHRRHRRRRAGLPGLAGDDEGRQGGRPRRRRHDDARDAAHRPRPGRRLRQIHAARCAGHRHRHVARRLQVHAQAHRRHPRHRPHQGDPRAHPEHAPGHARQFVRAAGPARRSSARTAAT